MRYVLLGYVCSAYTGHCGALVPGSCGVVFCGNCGSIGCMGVSDGLSVVFGDFLHSFLPSNYSCEGGVVSLAIFLPVLCLRYSTDVP